MRLFSAAAILAAGAICQAPGAHWTQLTTNTPPNTRENPGVSDGSLFYVFGGIPAAGANRSNALHAYDPVANNWNTLTADGAAGSPAARAQCAITWDFARGRLVVFGGSDTTGARLGDTWEWDGTAWSNVTPAGTSPSARSFCAMAFDWVNGKVLLFGGNDGVAPHLNDTWQWDGTTWTQLNPAHVPPVRQQHLMVARADHVDIVMAVGQNTVRLADTWTWNGFLNDWTLVTSATTAPASRVALDAGYDQVRQMVVITGGNNSGLNPTGQISEFDGVDWVNRTPIPNPRPHNTRYFFAFVAATGKSYTFGGQTPGTGTWEYQTDSVATVTPYGAGCSGPGGTLVLTADNLPWTRNQTENPGPVTFHTTTTGLGASSVGLAIVSLGQVAPGAFPLTNLTGVVPGPGAGCDLLVSSLDLTAVLIPSGGTATYSLGLGDLAVTPALQDLPLFVQVAELDLSAGWFGTYTSNGLDCKVGVL
ncbi:MAG TPA: kelch repeat-containing protein [Planctomycetota bacterium]|nr:kelch repeat-containing protein [Planctomycetota bacterium]